FKLRRRWMPWILLAILLLFSQLAVQGNYFSFRHLSSGGDVPIGGAFGQAGPRGRPETVRCADITAEPPRLPSGVDATLVAGLRAQCAVIAQQRAEQLSRLYATFTLPGAIGQALTTASSFGVILMAILSASIVGTEYG